MSSLTYDQGNATIIVCVSFFASIAIPISPLQVATASASTSSHFPPLHKNTRSKAAAVYPEAKAFVTGHTAEWSAVGRTRLTVVVHDKVNAPVKVPATIQAAGSPVAFVSVPDEGVHKAPLNVTKAPADHTFTASAVHTPVQGVIPAQVVKSAS